LTGNYAPLEDTKSNVTGDGPHENRRHAVADLLYTLFKFPSKNKIIREGSEPLELGKGKATLLIPVHLMPISA